MTEVVGFAVEAKVARFAAEAEVVRFVVEAEVGGGVKRWPKPGALSV
jgi:hypothetical protein